VPADPSAPTVPRLETERLVLRELRPADAEDLFRIFSDEEAMRYWSCRPFKTREQAERLIATLDRSVQEGVGLHWAISLRGLRDVPGEDRLIGKCSFNEWRKTHRRGDISYIVGREQWGKGIVSEALRAMLAYGFGPMNLHSIEAGVTPGNEGSTRMLEKLGFHLEGHLRESYWAEDRFVDSLIYSLLRREWEGAA
jgi:ribosomal-protein-alanine N-acetyltransferase